MQISFPVLVVAHSSEKKPHYSVPTGPFDVHHRTVALYLGTTEVSQQQKL